MILLDRGFVYAKKLQILKTDGNNRSSYRLGIPNIS